MPTIYSEGYSAIWEMWVELVTMAGNLKHRLYNIGSGMTTSQRQIVDAVRKAIPGAEITLRSGGGPHARPNAQPGHHPGQPGHRLQDSVRHRAGYCRAHRLAG